MGTSQDIQILFMTMKINSDIVMLFISKILRMFSFGAISVVFFDALIHKGIFEQEIGYLQSFIAVGDIIISLILTTKADRIGRKKTLIYSALLKIGAGLCYAVFDNYLILLISGALGVLTVSGGEIGPFLPIEQAALAQIVEEKSSSREEAKEKVALIYGYYNMASYISQASGNIFAGFYIKYVPDFTEGYPEDYYVHMMYMYALFGFFKLICYMLMSNSIQPKPQTEEVRKGFNFAGLNKESMKTISLLSILFMADSFAGGFVAQSFISFYYEKKYDLQLDSVGGLLFICNIVGGISGVVSSKLVAKIGAMATMIFTHLPSNVFLILIALTNQPLLALLFLMGRFCISQMDVPARQTYVSMIVSAEERSAANGITNIARSVGVALAFPIAGFLWNFNKDQFYFSIPFIIAGGIKICYDLTLGACFLWSKSAKKEEQEKKFQELEETDIANDNNVGPKPEK